MKLIYAVTFFLCFLFQSVSAQTNYVLDLKPENWNFVPGRFYFSEIVDERKNKSSAGQVLVYDKKIPAQFKTSLVDDLKIVLSNAMIADSNKIPLILSIEKYSLNETGNTSHHKLILDYSIKIYRSVNNKRYVFYEVGGQPEIEMKGNFPKGPEKITIQSLRSSIENLDKWLKDNPNQELLAKSIKVIFEPEEKYLSSSNNDTLLWNKNYKLKWSDFRGRPDGSGFMAQSGCLFTYRAVPVVKNDVLELHISLFAGFDKNTSWVIKGQEKDTLLAHEQLHFDICELSMRTLRKNILNAKLDLMEFGAQIETLFSKAWNDYQVQQQLYDDETSHGIIADKQQSWQRIVNSQLDR